MEKHCQKLLAVVILALAILGSGFFIAKAFYLSRAQESYVTVKGLASREVKANLSLWEIDFREVGDNLVAVNQQLAKDQQVVVAFLMQKGFKNYEIEARPAKVNDLLANPYSSQNPTPEALKNRYIITAGVKVRSVQVDLLQTISQQTGELLNKGIPLSFDAADFAPNPSYFYTGLDAIRPAMLADATKSARAVAEQFAKDSGNHLGMMRRANQGVFQIMSRDSSEIDGNAQEQLGSIYKKIRLVTTIDYFIK